VINARNQFFGEFFAGWNTSYCCVFTVPISAGIANLGSAVTQSGRNRAVTGFREGAAATGYAKNTFVKGTIFGQVLSTYDHTKRYRERKSENATKTF